MLTWATTVFTWRVSEHLGLVCLRPYICVRLVSRRFQASRLPTCHVTDVTLSVERDHHRTEVAARAASTQSACSSSVLQVESKEGVQR